MDNSEKINQLQQKTEKNTNDVKQLKEFYLKQETTLSKIDKKLDRLLFLESQSEERFAFHKVACREDFDKRYVMKLNLRTDVLDILQHIRHEDIQDSSRQVSILNNIMNIAWKIASVIGIGYLLFDKLF